VFEFDDLCSSANCLLANASASTSEYASESVSPPTTLELKPPPDSLENSFIGPDESLPLIIASNLDRDQKNELLLYLERTSKPYVGL